MKFSKMILAGFAIAAVTFVGMPTVYGGLVFENELNENTPNPSANQNSPLTTTIIQAQPQAMGELAELSEEKIVADTQPLTVASDTREARMIERENPSKAEMMRRQRMRQELKNEDLVTQKLEELRLKDELKRTNQILGSDQQAQQAQAAQAQAQTPIETQAVGSVELATPVAPEQTVVAQNAVDNISVSAVNKEEAIKEDSNKDESLEGSVKITPRGGISNISNSFYDVESKYSIGIDVGVDISDHFGFVGGYTYSKFSFGAGNTIYNPYSYNLQKLELSDNVINVGGKLYVLGRKSRVRPFVGAGMAYRKGYVNYDDRTLQMLRAYGPYYTQDVKLTAFMGYLETGLEFQITKSIALTGSFRYFNILSAKQTNTVPANAFVNPYGSYGTYGGYATGYNQNGYNNGLGYNQDAKSSAGDALARENFFQLMGGISVSF